MTSIRRQNYASELEKNNEHSLLFLPDFCSLRMVFSVVVIGELLAFVLTFTPLVLDQQRWNDLALNSLFIQWNALLGSAALCSLRPFFKKFTNQFVALASYLVLLLIVTFISEFSFFLMSYYQVLGLISSVSHWEFLLHNLFIGGIISALALRYFYIQHQWRIKMQAESCTKLQLLQARIRPHFLFNSMNTIASLTRTRPELAERITEDLAELFRMLFKEDHELIPWSSELLLSKRYLEIEAQRLGERLCVSWHIDALPGNAMVPALLLQPLLENAIFHGVEPEINGGAIKVSGELKRNRLMIIIKNTIGEHQGQRQGNKMALNNIRERLDAHFQGKASIQYYRQEDSFIVELVMPYQKQE